MITFTTEFQAELDKGRTDPRVLVDGYEFYAHDYVPGPDGFDPADALECFAGQEMTWNGIAYRREVISRGDILLNVGERTNTVTIQFSNISRYLATFAQTQTIEGMLVCIRCIAPAVTNDSRAMFHGRADKPGDIDKGRFELTARQDFGNINQTTPPRKFTADDPEGRLPGDDLFEGIPFVQVTGTYQYPFVRQSNSTLGRITGRRTTDRRTEQYSSIDNTPYGSVIPEVIGRCQMELIPFISLDKGIFISALWAAANGPITAIQNIKTQEAGLSDPINSFAQPPAPAVVHLGDAGGTGTNQGNTGQADLGGGSKFSHLAYIEGAIVPNEYFQNPSLSDPNVLNELPVVTALVLGRRVALPDADGEYTLEGWSVNPVNIARFILTHPQFVNIDPAFMEDAVNFLTAQYCDEPLMDESQLIVIDSVDVGQAGDAFNRYRSTGIINPRRILYGAFGDETSIPETVDGPYVGVSLLDSPEDLPCAIGFHRDPASGECVPDVMASNATQPLLRNRYTVSFPITEEIRAVDLLYKIVFVAAKLFMRVNKYGRYEIRTEKPSDATRLRSATAVGVTSIPVFDVTPWKSGPDLLSGRLLLGVGLETAEVRNITSAVYSTSGNSISLAASDTGGVVATASGATLSGGSTTIQASGTITLSGTPGAGDTITATIDGVVVAYILGSEDTLGTAAAMLHYYINATQRLRKYIIAEWNVANPNVITIKCLHGALNVDSAFLKTHTGPIADPITAPTLAASIGSLQSGTYQVAYADVNANGLTALTLLAVVTLAANQKIDVSSLPAFPAGVTSRQFFVSEAPGSTQLRYQATRVNAANFSIDSLPLPNAALPPSSNSTGEELIRVAMSFATNSQDVFPAWRASTAVILNDVYLPSVLNGHKYQVTTAGTTGSSEPTWPTGAGATVASGSVVFTEIGSTVLQQAGLARANIIKDTYKWPLGGRQSSVNQIEIPFRDAKNDFALTTTRINDPDHQAQVKKVYPLKIDGSAIDNPHQAFRIGNFYLSKNREGDWFNALETGPQGLVLEEGDPICSSDDSGGLINVVTRIEEIRIKPNHEVAITQARKYSTTMFSDDVGSHVIPIASTLRYVATLDSVAEFLDTPAYKPEDGSVPGFYISGTRDLSLDGDWRGYAVYADYGDGYKQVAQNTTPATLGLADSTLPDVADITVLDETNDLDVTLKYAAASSPFSNATEAELLANPRRNLFLVGDELIQVGTIVDSGNRSFTLSDILHGRFETSCVDHSIGERVVYIDGAEVFVPTDASRIGTEYNYKIVTTNQDVSDATAIPFTWTGNILRAAKPTSLNSVWDESGNIHSSMVGHPELEDGSAQYMFRFRRFSDGLFMRDLPATGNSPTSFAATFPDVSGDITVENNNVHADGGVLTFGLARSSQVITETDSFVEATIAHDDTTDPSTHSVFVAVELTSPDNDPWDNPLAPYKYRFELGGPDPTRTTAVYSLFEPDGAGGLHDVSDNGSLLLPAKIRISFVGTQVRFYVDWINSNSKPIAVGVSPVEFPLKVRVVLFSGNKILNMRIGGLSDPQTIYSTAQQAKDNEDHGGTGPLTDITVEGWQVSPLVPPDFKGRSVGPTRFTA